MTSHRHRDGSYKISHGLLRFTLARSEDCDGLWELAPGSTMSWRAIGEPERAPKYARKRDAIEDVRALAAHPEEQRRLWKGETE